MADSRPIAVFDSGLGGLTVVKALQEKLPNESIIYFGDTARVPYGNKSQSLIQEYAIEITEFLIKQEAKMVIVACNTASSLALKTLVSKFNIPILGVIDPGTEAAIRSTKNGHIGVVGTIATIRSGAYEKALKQHSEHLEVYSQSCPLFVPLVEEGWLEGDVPDLIAETYLKVINVQEVDTLILGCTHYPLLKPVIQKALNSGTVLVDSAESTANKTQVILTELALEHSGKPPGKLTCYVTDLPVRFKSVATRFLGASIDHVSNIHLS